MNAEISEKNIGILITLTYEDLARLGITKKNINSIQLETEFSEDAERIPVKVTGSKHPIGLFVKVKEN